MNKSPKDGKPRQPSAVSKPDVRVMVLLTSLARTSGGGRTFVHGLANALTADFCRPIFIVPRGHTGEVLEFSSDACVVEVAALKGMSRIVRDLIFCSRWAQENNADVVVIPHEWVPSTRAPVINIIQNVLYIKEDVVEKSSKARAMRWIIRRTMKHATATLSVAATTRDTWALFSGQTSEILPEGVDEAFTESAIKEREDQVVVITGPAKYKNPDLSEQVAHQIAMLSPSVKTTLVGIQNPGNIGPVQYISWMDQSDLARLLGRACTVVFLSEVESFGLPAFEARAAGARVIVFAGTPMAEWLADDPFVRAIEPTRDAKQIVQLILDDMESAEPVTAKHDYNWGLVGRAWLEYILGVADADQKRRASI